MKRIDKNNPFPLYMQLRDILREQVLSGEKKPGDHIPYECDLCKMYKVSTVTVKNALKELEKEGLIIRIKRKGTFVADTNITKEAANLRRNNTLAYIVSDIENIFISDICKGIEEVVNKKGYRFAVYSSARSVKKEIENINLLKERREEGAIIFPNWGRFNAEQIFELKREGILFVLIDRYFRDIVTDTVTVDNTGGAYLAVKHLINLGYKKIAHISGVDCTANEDRLEGYKRALNEEGILYNPKWVKEIVPNNRNGSIRFEPDDIGGYKEVKRLLSLKDKPEAIFAGNDYLALGALKAIKEAGLRVPEDIALVGFDDLRFSSTLEVPLTTISQPKFEIGKKATEILINKIEANKKGNEINPKQVVLPVKLVVRQSCGAQLLEGAKK